MSDIHMIIGLGNPGREFRDNRHNIGFMLMDRLTLLLGTRFTRLQSSALVASVIRGDQRLVLVKPQTFMNNSGRSAQGLVRFHKLSLDRLLVAYDDLDLPIGVIRIRPDGGSGGHKGMTSIIEKLGTDQFARIRLGIGRPPGKMLPPDYVLQDFSDPEQAVVSETLTRAAEATMAWIQHGLDFAMNSYNGNSSASGE